MATSKSLLVVVLEINKSLFASKSNSPKSLNSFANAIVAFLKSHHLLNRDNRSMTIACGNNEAEFLAQENYDSTTYATFSSSLASRIEKFGTSGGGGLGSAVSMALCHIQKYVFSFFFSFERSDPVMNLHIRFTRSTKKNPDLRSRILVIRTFEDFSSQYVSLMNSIFCAQKFNVIIDSCILNSSDSAMMQQASHATGGIYHRVREDNRPILVQYLLAVFSSDPHVRQKLLMPRARLVDYRASCFCHSKLVNQGYVCAVCLSVFCEQPKSKCPTCGVSIGGTDVSSS